MARDYLTIGSTPYGEDCAQVGADNYHEMTRIETRAFVDQLVRQFGEPPEGVRFTVKAFPHDFGTYHEVAISFNDEDQASVEYAYDVENSIPEYWDEQARSEITQALQKIGA